MKHKKRRKKTSGRSNTAQLGKMVLAFLNEKPFQRFTLKKIAKALKVRKHNAKIELEAFLNAMAKKDLIHKHPNETYQSVTSAETEHVTGTVDFVNARFAYIIPEGEENAEDVWVKSGSLRGAMDRDKVKIRVYKNSRRNRLEGEVVEIVERNTEEFVGHIEISNRFAFVVPNSRKIHTDIFIPLDDINGAEHKDKVVIKIIEWPHGDDSPVGKVTRVLGKSGENDTEIHAIMFEYGLPFDFPQEVEAEANKIPLEIPGSEIKKRRDLRDTTTFTIDPLTAKDFDDALSVKQLDNGNWEIGVHIADVTHYVKPNSILEKEAFRRATSVYLVDRTVPMLPENLSNGLCSLRPNEDKLTFSAIFELDPKGNIIEEWFGRTVIHSDRRFTYEEAQEVLETGEGDFKEELFKLNELAKLLNKKRFRAGAISFESVELYFELDEKGKPVGLFPKIRKDAHKLIEEFMLLANKRVAEFVFNQRKGKVKNTMVYRVHEDPDPERVDIFAKFLKRFGYNISQESGGAFSKSLNQLSKDIEGKTIQNIIQYQAIRTMAKARYTTEPIGHYGLAFKHYSHFTSPIRRYPDMMAHRLLQHYLDGGQPVDKKEYEEKCKHSSEREKRAADAERASIKYKQVEFMETFLNKELDGFISGTTDWGIYVEMNETKCEGMIRLSDMKDDYYAYDEEAQMVIGKKFKEKFMIGDPLRVKVKATNLDKRTIDLELIGRLD
ncbi:ribonuclease R [Flexithrix dorotheae]|uniref:ribonuclease R n=1 Tax=Flexithrix dorotheae TaxID=70993 RepID=UPI000370AFC5|nr:ribonuclease R [Flexithrix dorotheae]